MAEEEWKLSSVAQEDYGKVLEENFGTLHTPPQFVPCERMHPGM